MFNSVPSDDLVSIEATIRSVGELRDPVLGWATLKVGGTEVAAWDRREPFEIVLRTEAFRVETADLLRMNIHPRCHRRAPWREVSRYALAAPFRDRSVTLWPPFEDVSIAPDTEVEIEGAMVRAGEKAEIEVKAVETEIAPEFKVVSRRVEPAAGIGGHRVMHAVKIRRLARASWWGKFERFYGSGLPCPRCGGLVDDEGEEQPVCACCGRSFLIAGDYLGYGAAVDSGSGLVVMPARASRDVHPEKRNIILLIEKQESSARCVTEHSEPGLLQVVASDTTISDGRILVCEAPDSRLGKPDEPSSDYDHQYRLARGLLESVRSLHARRRPVVHGAICPSNVGRRRTDPGERIVLVDWPDESTAKEEPASSYRAPEYRPDRPTVACDLYSIGATVLASASGIEPDKWQRRKNTVTRRTLSAVAWSMRPVIRRLLEPDPAVRYASADDALADLEASTGSRRWMETYSYLLMIAVGTLLLLLISVAVRLIVGPQAGTE